MIQNKIDANPTLDAYSAAKLVRVDLGTNANANVLYDDYVSDDNKDSVEHKKKYQTAQTVARLMGEIEKALKTQFEVLGLTLDTEITKLIQKQVQNKIESLAKTLFADANTFIDDGNEVDHNRSDTVVEANNNDFTTEIEAEFTNINEITRQKEIANRDTSDDKLDTVQNFTDKDLFSAAAEVQDGSFKVYLEAWTTDKLYNSDTNSVSTTDFSNEYVMLDEGEAITKIKDEFSSKSLTNNADGSVEFSFGNGEKILVFNMVKQSIAGLTLNCNELISDEDGRNIACKSVDYKNKTVMFAEGVISNIILLIKIFHALIKTQLRLNW